tara:strand:- start:3171 stop:3599 length:429 start_codon:yes stop_codon:yes gene_type:complete
MKTYITGIPSSQVPEVWEDCVPFIKLGNSKSQDEMTTNDIYELLCNAEMQLWVIINSEEKILGAGTTQILDYPNKKICRIVTLGGQNFDNWIQSIKTIEEWSRVNNCKSVEFFCRKGFQRKLEDYGYKQTYTVLGKELTSIH